MSEQIDIDISNLQFYSRLFREQQWQTPQLHWSVFEQTLREVADRIAQAKERERKLTEFFREGMQGAFEGCDWNGADIQNKAVELGLARWDKFDPEQHSHLSGFGGGYGEDICIINDPPATGISADADRYRFIKAFNYTDEENQDDVLSVDLLSYLDGTLPWDGELPFREWMDKAIDASIANAEGE